MNRGRVEIYSLYETGPIKKARAYLIETKNTIDENIMRKVFSDPLSQVCTFSLSETRNFLKSRNGVEMFYRPGVTDNVGKTAEEILSFFGIKAKVSSGNIYYTEGLTPEALMKRVQEHYANGLIHRTAPLSPERFSAIRLPKIEINRTADVTTFQLHDNFDNLFQITQKRSLALSPQELETIISRYKGKKDTITDVELEIFAQTWSEHCKHKIFNATIDYSESEHSYKKIERKTVEGLFPSYIEAVTKKLSHKFLVSVFKDNAGIVRFDGNVDLCFKVETHNAPSALEPYGGALTGILGVNRDILGTGLGAKPICNTDIFCLPPLDLEKHSLENLPRNVALPRRMLEGVHRGVEDGGNKSGIPTVNGSMLFDESYTARPLVYVGCVGVMPQTINGCETWKKKARNGDFIYMVGGDVGIDGIHGATFSSMELSDSSPSTAVQIGDPFTQKKLTDFLLEARDNSLFNSVTDNGAGGLSSSVGEMAKDCHGAVIFLETVPLKYPNLSPWEIVVSESQERMTFAVSAEKSKAFEQLACAHNTKAACIGKFEDTGYFSVKNNGESVAKIEMGFLYNGNPKMHLKAHWSGPKRQDNPYRHHNKQKRELPPLEALKYLLGHPNIASKEPWVRRYDHEVQGQTTVKPFYQGRYTSPADAGVLLLQGHGGEEDNAVAVGHGLQPFLSELDPYLMAIFSVDECVRNLICSGGKLSNMALLDNFCWPNPIHDAENPKGEYRLGQLVRACEGLYDICLAYGLPLISGKDSMKNDYNGLTRSGEKLSCSVLPTLLISGMAQVDTHRILPSFAPRAGEYLVELGKIDTKRLTAGAYERMFETKKDSFPIVVLDEHFHVLKSIESLRDKGILSSLHDISDGGAFVSIAEMLFVRGLGAEIQLQTEDNISLFGEGPTCFMAAISPDKIHSVQELMGDNMKIWGKTCETKKVTLNVNGKKTESLTSQLAQCWNEGLSHAYTS